MGIKCSNTVEVYFDNTPIPAENLIGGVCDGFKEQEICRRRSENADFADPKLPP
ncbi:unnamed protein product [Oikopleura dioica]|uniref:Uncharacterized protein n=1 Tax=Oikopleura dioica TaxID=34765 RepID=E4XL96_OIKDI|nr:unnamed protein product [Oikopleura dioica]